ncbi:glycosyl hydrolase family 16 laminarinase (macronuclear) [Tetrahymena thermophila SB210]|uniref:Glycosyl hydrolase family 16 laminarinase n=1 Tax=Tetrahymena thermophila (strain SB210) TaxID=312017 RepID=Q22LL6_TETTS|nr:glycosyl hydrolase family 16 laminarinase [Tetrahymena thermophila SB210]EAR86124.2 glycosyl hydrolase family 16 laminarinase [Tetrahymena thermophila SB210]|eukprot:XP_976719.2 glycosyl hydrolase family 16 laminarinase [Tetrahymena thermophila SB210]
MQQKMKNIKDTFAFISICAFLFVLSSASHDTTGSPSQHPDVINYQDFTLQFEDEFNQADINTKYWKVGDNFLINSLQFQIYTKENVKIKEGNLVLSAQYQSTTFEQIKYNYSGGYLESRGSQGFKFKYGYAEARIKLPKLHFQDSSFPAFWALPDPAYNARWPYSVEMDIMEYCNVCSGKDTNDYVYSANIYGNRQQYGDCRIWYRSPMKQITFTDYHLYGMLWTENEMTFYIDGVAYYSYVFKDPSNNKSVGCPIVIPNKNFFLIFDFAVIKDYAKPEHYKEPKEMYVDYVKVYSLNKK